MKSCAANLFVCVTLILLAFFVAPMHMDGQTHCWSIKITQTECTGLGGCEHPWEIPFCVAGVDGSVCLTGYGLCCGTEVPASNIADPCQDAPTTASSRQPDVVDVPRRALLYVPNKCSRSHGYGIVLLNDAGIPVSLKSKSRAQGGM